MRPLVGALACLLLGSGLSACGDPIDNYCEVIKEHRKELNEMVDAGTQFGLITHLPMLQELNDAAPEDLTDEWQVFLSAVKHLTEVVDDTGHPPEDFADQQMPADLTSEEKTAITAAANRLSSQETVAASAAIDQQARDVCKVNL
ncbi:MAG: hypothetical protein EOO74_01460, partial [Myxococcales bacterium]